MVLLDKRENFEKQLPDFPQVAIRFHAGHPRPVALNLVH